MSASPAPQAPESFARAYAALRELVEGLAQSGASADSAARARAWQAGPCVGSDSLAKAAALAMRHEIAAARLAEGAAISPSEDPEYGALRVAEQALWPSETEEMPSPVGVELPPALRERLGRAEAIFSPSPTVGAILSVSRPDRFPTVEELRRARLAFGRGGPAVYMELPAGDGKAGPPYVVKLLARPPAGER